MAELVPLPRAQVGPFLILGVPKDAPLDTIDAAWAKRLIWARKKQTDTPLEDINWARETLKEPPRRLQADAATLNIDTVTGYLNRLEKEPIDATNQGKPIDVEKDLSQYVPSVTFPDAEQIRKGLPTPEIPRDVPAVSVILRQTVDQPLDPWELFKDE